MIFKAAKGGLSLAEENRQLIDMSWRFKMGIALSVPLSYVARG